MNAPIRPGPRSAEQEARRAAAYCRVSSLEQVEGTSIEDQRTRCSARIEAEGWELVGFFIDEGISGAAASRPRLDALMAECRAGTIDVVVVSRLDRFGRSSRHLENALGELDDLGVDFVSLSESFDSSSASGRLLRTMLGGTAEFERASIRERTLSGLWATAAAGFWPGGPPPYGFTIVEDGKHKRLAVEDREAEMLRAAVTLLVDQRMTTREAAAELNALGMKPRRADRWTYQNLRRTLMDAQIVGEWVYGRGRGSSAPSPRGPLPIAIPSIISVDRHDQLLDVLSATTNIRRKSNTYLLSGGRLIAQCGARYQGYPRPSGRRQYRCYARRTYIDERCGCRMIDADDVEGAVWNAMRDLLSDPDRLLAMASDFLELRRPQGKIERSQLSDAKRRVKKLEKGLASAYQQRFTEGRDRGAIDLAIQGMESDLAAARSHEASVAAWETQNQADAERVAGVRQLAELARARLADMPLREQRRVLDVLDVRAEVTSWSMCGVCKGRGKVESRPRLGGLPCPACHITRWLPTVRVEGVVYERLLRDTLGDGHSDRDLVGLPFRVEELGVA